MRIALIHYWLIGMRGGEKVLECLCRMFPEADLFTHVCTPDAISPVLRKHNIKTSFIQKLPFSARMYQKYLPLMPLALEQLDLRAYDLVISSESGPAKGVLTRSDTPHICYCHTPMRYLWDFYQDYLEETGTVTRLLMRPLFHRLRMWDVLSANRVDHFVANSRTVARRIARHYRREAEVIHPPVDVARFTPEVFREPDDYYLCLGQLTGYKRTDIAVKACTRLNKKLLVVGHGPEEDRLKAMAGPTISFTGRLEGRAMIERMQRCKALIFPGEEDFGIVPVEAMAAGRPVVAYARGGATETVVEGTTGLLFTEQSATALADALEQFESKMSDFNPAAINAHAGTFSETAFTKAFTRVVQKATSQDVMRNL